MSISPYIVLIMNTLTSLLILLSFTASSYSRNVVNHGTRSQETMERVYRVLGEYPVIDGHNDFAMGLRSQLRNNVEQLNFDHDLTQEEPWASYYANHVDLPRMRKGQMGGQFWSAFVGCKSQFADAVQLFLEQIDVIKQFVARWGRQGLVFIFFIVVQVS